MERGTYSLPFMTATQDLLSTIMLRRTKANVELDVPPKEMLAIFLPLTELQRFWTYRLLTRMDTVDLNQIFTAEINPEDGNANQGRREVLSHLENQMHKVRTGGGESHCASDHLTIHAQRLTVCLSQCGRGS